MRLVMTLLARDEADIVEAWLAFHLNAGADFVIATDNLSKDGTTEILEAYARDGFVHLIHEPTEGLRQDEWVTRMARLAAAEFGADWVINSDADEFWWPRGASLVKVLDAIPARYGTVSAFWRFFVPRPDDDSSFAERMTARFSARAPIHDPASLARPIRKVIHRADPDVNVARGNHGLVGSSLAPLRGWFPIEVLHFPIRSREQCKHKAVLQGEAFEKFVARPPTAYHANMYEAFRSGTIDEHYDSLVVEDEELAEGLAQGSFVVDTRLRDALRELRGADGAYALPSEGRALRFPTPTLVDDAEYAVEAAILGEADVVRLQRRIDTLETRLLSLELRLPNRVYRKLSRTAKRVLGRDTPDDSGSA